MPMILFRHGSFYYYLLNNILKTKVLEEPKKFLSIIK